MIPGFSTIKTWMRILHGSLKRQNTEDLKINTGTLLYSQTQWMWLHCKVIKSGNPLPFFQVYPPVRVKHFAPPPPLSDSIFGSSYPHSWGKGGSNYAIMLLLFGVEIFHILKKTWDNTEREEWAYFLHEAHVVC